MRFSDRYSFGFFFPRYQQITPPSSTSGALAGISGWLLLQSSSPTFSAGTSTGAAASGALESAGLLSAVPDYP